MKGELKSASGYQDNHMSLPVENLAAALPFYETVMGFRVLSRAEEPHKSAVLERDGIQIGLAESGGDPTQDGCAFKVDHVEALLAELQANGLNTETGGVDIERQGEEAWKVFYVVAPDGLCYWFGERQP